MRPKARVLAVIRVMPKLLLYVLYTSNWNYQMLAAEQLLAGQAAWVALPNFHHGKNNSYKDTILQLSWSGSQLLRPEPVHCKVGPHRIGTHNTSKGINRYFLRI
jgi:hypothetical protein